MGQKIKVNHDAYKTEYLIRKKLLCVILFLLRYSNKDVFTFSTLW